ncbi:MULTISPECIES: class I SAM-dependent methyltransferase [unclassified Endozoicomonas]|uniref:class I SAM-dependent methyltransferase n=1 Tax=unclassified Endozoicomonas TaxID=2644528 RepID=UPI0021498AE9|nr:MULTISPECIES: class I SAM-dependent methyltransferase [unclassified Endozoicomonas]
MTVPRSKITNEQVHRGQAVYSKGVLNIYDIAVLGISNRLVWQCPTPILLDWFNQHVSNPHLDIGVGTGYFPDHCQFPTCRPSLTLVDLNTNSLDYAGQRLKRYQPSTLVHNVFKPFTTLPVNSFSSISINYLLHCLPGSIHSKAVVFDHFKPLLNEGGKLFGATILRSGVTRTLLAKALMGIYNRKGIFSNQEDHLDGLEHELCSRFNSVDIQVTGCVARFVAINK